MSPGRSPNNSADKRHVSQRSVESLKDRISKAILDIAGAVPKTGELESDSPDVRARGLARKAAATAATISGAAAIAPGPLGLLTLVPDVVGVWRVQAQMVADIAGTYGKSARLTQEQMLYCLFRHLVSQGLRDVVVRVGERYLVRRATLGFVQSLAAKIGVKVSQRLIGKAVARYIPIAGAVSVGAYAAYDTMKVARTAIDLFRAEIMMQGTVDIEDVEVKPVRSEKLRTATE
jgi:hypothetical protein